MHTHPSATAAAAAAEAMRCFSANTAKHRKLTVVSYQPHVQRESRKRGGDTPVQRGPKQLLLSFTRDHKHKLEDDEQHRRRGTRSNRTATHALPAVETPSFSMIFTPNLPPQPLTLSTGSARNTRSTLFRGSTVWAFGLCMLLHSLARSLLCATPVVVVVVVVFGEEKNSNNKNTGRIDDNVSATVQIFCTWKERKQQASEPARDHGHQRGAAEKHHRWGAWRF